MATSARTRIHLLAEAILESGIVGSSGGQLLQAFDDTLNLADGTSSGQADRIYYASRSLNASASESLDLAGVLTDIYGNTLTFAKVKGIFIKITSTASAKLEVGPVTAGNGFGIATFWKAAADKDVLIPGDILAKWKPDGAAVTAGSADLLAAAETGGSNAITYRILIVGTSA